MSTTDISPPQTPPSASGPSLEGNRPRGSRWIPFVVIAVLAASLVAVAGMIIGLAANDQTRIDSAPSTSVDTSTEATLPADETTTTSAASTTTASTNVSTTDTTVNAAPDTTLTATLAKPIDIDTCSATGYASSSDQADLPDAVAAKRAAIIEAASDCDIAGLVALTGELFTASFGGGNPATLWAEAEVRGERPMLTLVQLLDQASGTMQSEGGDFYAWPTAFLHDSWDDVTEAEIAALALIYGQDDLDAFEQAGSYLGYRIAIHESGDWAYFVAGD